MIEVTVSSSCRPDLIRGFPDELLWTLIALIVIILIVCVFLLFLCCCPAACLCIPLCARRVEDSQPVSTNSCYNKTMCCSAESGELSAGQHKLILQSVHVLFSWEWRTLSWSAPTHDIKCPCALSWSAPTHDIKSPCALQLRVEDSQLVSTKSWYKVSMCSQLVSTNSWYRVSMCSSAESGELSAGQHQIMI